MTKYSTRKPNNRTDSTDREGTKNLFLNGWTKAGQLKYNELMEKIRNDRCNYGDAFDKGFLKFCKQMAEKALEKRPAKRKRSVAYVQIVLDHNIPPVKAENNTLEIQEQIKNTNQEMGNWVCDTLDENLI